MSLVLMSAIHGDNKWDSDVTVPSTSGAQLSTLCVCVCVCVIKSSPPRCKPLFTDRSYAHTHKHVYLICAQAHPGICMGIQPMPCLFLRQYRDINKKYNKFEDILNIIIPFYDFFFLISKWHQLIIPEFLLPGTICDLP